MEFRLLLTKQLIREFHARQKQNHASQEPSPAADHGFAFGIVGEKKGWSTVKIVSTLTETTLSEKQIACMKSNNKINSKGNCLKLHGMWCTSL